MANNGTTLNPAHGRPVDRSEAGHVVVTRVGLRIPAALSFEEWERAGHRLAGLVDSSAWWLGDWLVFGKDRYADRYQRAIAGAGLSYQTLRNYAWVAGRFEHRRRRAALTFQHHVEVASLPGDAQERLLDQAERQSWTTRQLRSTIRAEQRDRLDPAAPVGGPKILLPPDRVDVWRQAAKLRGLDFQHWVQTSLDQAAAAPLP
jgi:hypothetical protein